MSKSLQLLKTIILISTFFSLPSCYKLNIRQVLKHELAHMEKWTPEEGIPKFFLTNKYPDTYYEELYEYGGLLNVAIINHITDPDLLFTIITSCDKRLDRTPSIHILEKINFGENRLFDFYYNYSTRKIAELRYRILYGSENLACRIKQRTSRCVNLDPDVQKHLVGIQYSSTQNVSVGFIIQLKRINDFSKITVDKMHLEEIMSNLPRNPSQIHFKQLDSVAGELINSILRLNPNATFETIYQGPYHIAKEKPKINSKNFEVKIAGREVIFLFRSNNFY